VTKAEILKQCKSEGVRFMRLQFTDIHGANKNVEIPTSQFSKALDGEIMFDGSSIEGFTRIEESDMLLVPDLDTFRVFPWKEDQGRVARIMCDVKQPDGSDFAGDPRGCLRRQVEKARKKGYTMMVGPEVEFFLFQTDDEGGPTTRTHDVGAYFDLAPVDRGEDCRRDIVLALEAMGFEVEAAHHEVAQGQHEIDFKYGDALATADNVATFRFLVRHIALDHGLHATFMPKPIFGQNGSGMHCHQSLFKGGQNAFYDPKKKPYQLSTIALHYIGGLLRHARGFLAITNPTVNSYKRLVPGYEAPTNVAWSERNRSPMIRIPAKRGTGTRCEVRVPDPSCNPYLAFSVMLAAGLDGMDKKTDPGEPVNKNVFTMSQREKARLKIQELPSTLAEALDAMEKDPVVLEALGDHLATSYVAGKRQHWNDFLANVHPWELEQYLAYY
jgi:glutamine synthetase